MIDLRTHENIIIHSLLSLVIHRRCLQKKRQTAEDVEYFLFIA